MSAARDLAELFPRGALVQLFGEGSPADPPAHHVAGIYPLDDDRVVFWDSEVGTQFVVSVKSVETLKETPVLLVKAVTSDGHTMNSENVGPRMLVLNAQLRPVQQEKAANLGKVLAGS